NALERHRSGQTAPRLRLAARQRRLKSRLSGRAGCTRCRRPGRSRSLSARRRSARVLVPPAAPGPAARVRICAWARSGRIDACRAFTDAPHAGEDARCTLRRESGAMKRIGLLGGMSWESSIEYYRFVNEEVRDRLGGLHSADCLLRSVDFSAIEEMQRAGRWEEAGEVLAAEALALERAGAELIVLCTNTMHKVA